MKWAIVYNPNERKLKKSAYSWSYRCMFIELLKQLGDVQHVISDCDASSIEADIILFWDIHSSHHIKIKGIESHPAFKVEYFDDPHQETALGYFGEEKTSVYKLGAKERSERALRRGVQKIICPYRDGFHRFLAPHLGPDANSMLVWQPISLSSELFSKSLTPLKERLPSILASGWCNMMGNNPPCYLTRRWFYEQNYVSCVGHGVYDKSLPIGKDYGNYLTLHAGVIAAMDYYPVPKYFEIPMAGCVTFAQYHKEYEDLGFKDKENCVYITKENFAEAARDFLWHKEDYQDIANAGRKLVLQKFTTDKFAQNVIQTIESCSQANTSKGG